ncbi:MAG: hydroxymethylbilane synthase [Anaerolineales bacterium]|nr:hydroxymethylbilane synthase [Anaerolineales bacterium]
MPQLIIGTRASKLALWQTNWVAQKLAALDPEIEFVVQTITTKGDTQTETPLPQIGDKGLFTREIETALIAGEIHCAVHSLKDLPTDPAVIAKSGVTKQSPIRNLEIASSHKPRLAMTNGLTLAAITEREDARDVLISRLNLGLDHLPKNARVGTSSLRRAAQLRAYRRDLQIVNLRGNVDTRLRKSASEEYDAIVLAAAGIVRLGFADRITEFLPLDVMLPAPGQGALAVQTRADNAATLQLLAPLDHTPTRAATTAERAFLRALGGGCQVPIAAYAETRDGVLHLRGLIASVDGTRVVRGEISGNTSQPEQIGAELANRLLIAGGGEILV